MNWSKLKLVLFSENSLIIWLPGVLVVTLFALFFSYGLRTPLRTEVPVTESLVKQQELRSEQLLLDYQLEPRTETNPFVQVDPFAISPLTALVMFDTETDASYVITIEGQEGEADVVYESPRATAHTIPIYGLYPDYDNTVLIHRFNQSTQTAGELVTTLQIDTAPLPPRALAATSIQTTEAYFGHDWMILTPSSNHLPVAIDAYGNVRWYSLVQWAFVFEPLANGHFLVGGDRLIDEPYYVSSLYEIDLLGQIYTSFDLPGGMHHDAMELPSGNLLVLSNDGQETVEDVVVEMSRTTGEIVKTWNVKDVLSMTEGKTAMWSETDWFHATSIDYDESTNSILVSGRHQDIVVNLDYDTGTLHYLLGDPTNWELATEASDFLQATDVEMDWFYGQHSVQFVSGNRIFLFDNGNNRSKLKSQYVSATNNYSRAVMLTVDPLIKTVTFAFEYGSHLGNSFYSPYGSNVAYYGADHFLVHSGGIASTLQGTINVPAPVYEDEFDVSLMSRTIEVENNLKQYDLEMAGNYYRALHIDPTTYMNVSIEQPRVLGHARTTPLYEGDVDRRIVLFESVRRHVNLQFEYEEDRLIMQGVFAETDEVYLELESGVGVKRYLVDPSTRVYAELFPAINHNDQELVTFYLNQAGLIGRYDLYLRINGKRYDTNQYVIFT